DNINMRTNEIMKTLALISTVFLPLTFLAGLYGMNFEYMPELKSEYGYPVCITVMAIIAIYLYRGFKAKNWL
ncbi:MAG: CorA family divalent cation transporter, partial [Acidaminococcaceae bacterium]